ncbi:YGR153W [Saccharomyces arboricola H-6]|uniref:YGR153W n=1 Tax=Saccharomyces arboricola (strain H-6 / AS 2.3317 / CBS 10644) TaxID=1160507 RepID=J8Q7G2_SACAR|nr:YGR153W [Saccharomyces arboricola H-6]
MQRYCLERGISHFEEDIGIETHSFFDSLSDIQDSSLYHEEQGDATSISNEDSVSFGVVNIDSPLLSLNFDNTDENKSDTKHILSPNTKVKRTRQKEKHSRGVALVAENSRKYLTESSLYFSQEYGTQVEEIIEQERDDLRPCGCHKSRKAKCFKELEIESLEKGDTKKSLFYRDINVWCKEYELKKTREICVPLIHEFYLNKSDSENLF